MRHLVVGGGQVVAGETMQLHLPATAFGYADAQIDDYGGEESENGRFDFKWHPNTTLQLDAKFSHDGSALQGTAGFGFWNAPYGDPKRQWPVLPEAVWFFFGSPPNDMPYFADRQGNGFVAATISAKRWQALRWVPFAPLVLLGNRFPQFKRRVWPSVLRDLGIVTQEITAVLSEWHTYRLHWGEASCQFWLDDQLILTSPVSPKGPLGFVCWIDNQYLVLTGNGRLDWGTLPTQFSQTIFIANRQLY
jgi:hypothetical protein